MAPQKKEGIEGLGLRLHSQAIRKLKVIAAERGVSLSSIAEEAFGLWWAQQPEAKTKGPLFPGEVENTPEPVATKETPKKIAAKETGAARPLAKTPRKPETKTR